MDGYAVEEVDEFYYRGIVTLQNMVVTVQTYPKKHVRQYLEILAYFPKIEAKNLQDQLFEC